MRHSARFLALLAVVVVALAGASATAMPKLEDQGASPAAARTPSPAPATADQASRDDAAVQPASEDGSDGAERAPAQQSSAPQPTPTPTPTPGSPTPAPSGSNPPGGGSGGSGGPGGPGGNQGDGRLEVSSSSSKLLAELGDVVEYTVTVSNPGDAPLEDVNVVETIAPELDVVSVAISDDADDISLGSGPRGEDIVWHISRLEADETLAFTWKGQAAAAGDLMAVNTVAATAAEGASSRDESTTFLGVDREVTADNPPPKPVEKKVVVYGTRIVNAAPPATAADGSVLPATGSNIEAFIYLGVVLLAAGLLILAIFRSSMNGKRAAVSAVLAALLLAACVSGTSEQAAPDNAPSQEQDVDVDAGDEGSGDQVKGKRIERTEEERQAEEGSIEAPTETDVAAPVTTETQPPVVERTRTVETVLVEPEDLPVDTLDSREGDNTTTYQWDLDTRAITQAASSVFYQAGATTELLTNVSFNNGSIDVTVLLKNLSEDTQLEVDGRLVHVVSGAEGQIARFESDPIDTTLAPGGSVSADFSYLLPSGGYSATSSFDAS